MVELIEINGREEVELALKEGVLSFPEMLQYKKENPRKMTQKLFLTSTLGFIGANPRGSNLRCQLYWGENLPIETGSPIIAAKDNIERILESTNNYGTRLVTKDEVREFLQDVDRHSKYEPEQEMENSHKYFPREYLDKHRLEYPEMSAISGEGRNPETKGRFLLEHFRYLPSALANFARVYQSHAKRKESGQHWKFPKDQLFHVGVIYKTDGKPKVRPHAKNIDPSKFQGYAILR